MPSTTTVIAELLSHVVGVVLGTAVGGFVGWGITARAGELVDGTGPGLQAVGIALGAAAGCVLVVRGLHTHRPGMPE